MAVERMSGTRTFYGNVPAAYRRAWLETVFPKRAAALGGDTNGGGILDLPSHTGTDELERLRRFGACWDWWGVPEHLRNYWRSLDG
jgi:hypothetical protein